MDFADFLDFLYILIDFCEISWISTAFHAHEFLQIFMLSLSLDVHECLMDFHGFLEISKICSITTIFYAFYDSRRFRSILMLFAYFRDFHGFWRSLGTGA